ncbi:glycoside hydrolase family 13 protein [Diplocloster agilis]|uniref:glycoside hydrolase family 13 protein n=1 Tax=Diplocloster agilis TaxID=2850323 RepID=UPI000821B345|nr:glycoside hydrolase family 13 protein [Suonthocola fibrivorans]MCU6732314.1 glycoside hydrolase family 13 protein [Suonthocola fibrivorans]SCI40253.1 Neopullulanase 1 precursor [uncultured Clostridium sp.]
MYLEDLEILEKKQKYINSLNPILNKKAIFSDGTLTYRNPMEPEPGETVTIRCRTGKNNVDSVYFISGQVRRRMEKELTEGPFDYYKVEITVGKEPLHYFFEINAGRIRCFYNERGISKDLQEYYMFSIVPGFKTPDWAKGAVMYQIFVDRFCNGDPTNDVENREYIYIKEGTQKVDDWYRLPDAMDVRSFYGGDLKGVMDKLDYLQDLGVEVVYLNPIFVSPSNHKYDIQDYDYVDPHFGVIVNDGGETLPEWENDNARASKYIQRVTDRENLEASNELLIQLIEEIHRRGMKIILDGVFNHCGSFNKWLDRERIYEGAQGYAPGAYVSADSPYRNFFKFNNEHEWPYNPYYDGWWGHDTLPKLNYEQSGELYDYVLGVARKWVSPPFSADGWRLDVAADLGHTGEFNHKFWKDFRRVVKEANPQALIVAEHYGNPGAWLQGDEWDTVMNYDAFMEPITWFLTGMEKHSDEFRPDMLGNPENLVGALKHHMSNFLMPSMLVAMNELSNHDHSRFLTRTNHVVGRVGRMGHQKAEEGINKGIFREAVVAQFTMPGAPTIYYGDEAGLCGFTDPDNRRSYPWGREDLELLDFHKEIIRIHRENKVLTFGSILLLAAEQNMVSYARFDRKQQMVIALNNREEEAVMDISVWETGIPIECEMERLMLTTRDGHTTEPETYRVREGRMELKLPPFSAVILRRR